MRKEIAPFTYYLTNRNIQTQRTTRMWFTKEQIYTKAFDILVRGNRTSIEKEIEEFLIDQFCTLELDELYYTTKDLHEQLNLANIRVGKNYVSKIITENFKLEPKNSSYNFYSLDLSTMNHGKWSVYTENRKGRFYTFKREEFIK